MPMETQQVGSTWPKVVIRDRWRGCWSVSGASRLGSDASAGVGSVGGNSLIDGRALSSGLGACVRVPESRSVGAIRSDGAGAGRPIMV